MPIRPIFKNFIKHSVAISADRLLVDRMYPVSFVATCHREAA